jgi:filamentous hemagglutinin family protein
MKTNVLLLLFTLIGIFSTQTAPAQIYQPSNRIPVADNSQIGTQVSGSNNNFEITGGLQRGQNLFHSFQDFSVPTGGSANFANPAGNQSMITRVTGNLFSDINGLIKTNGANFLLINPNGVVFGSGVSLDVGKSLITSTANGINLVDGSGGKIIFGTNPSGDTPLLSIAPDVLFNVANLNIGGGSGQISNFGTLQTTNDSQYIGLIGGNVNLNGGKIIVPGGRVDIGGLNTDGIVGINSDGLVFDGIGLTESNVSIANGSSISVRASQTLNPVDPIFFPTAISPGSSINISANQIDLLNSGDRFIPTTSNPTNQALGGLDAGLAVNAGTKTSTIGNINLNATGDINLNQSAIFNLVRSGATGTGGGINITGNNINITNKSEISTSLAQDAAGRGGNVDITAKGNFNFTQANYPGVTASLINVDTEAIADSLIAASTYGRGDSGKVQIAAGGSFVVGDNSAIASTVAATGSGNSAGIKISANSVTIRNGGQILTSVAAAKTSQVETVKNNAGKIEINSQGDVLIFGSDTVNEDRNNSTRLARIESNNFRVGDSGQVNITAPDGKLAILNRGAIISSIRGTGNGRSNSINLNVKELLLGNLSEISSSLGGRSATGQRETKTRGKAGDINIQAIGDVTVNEYLDSLIVKKFEGNATGPSGIYSSINGTATEDGGKITINTLGKVSVGNHDVINSTIEREGEGSPGGIEINARELEVFNEGQILTVAARYKGNDLTKKGNAGNIDIKTTGNVTVAGNQDPTVGRNDAESSLAKIASNSFRNGNAGKITIEAGGIVSLFNKGGIVTQCLQDCKSQITNTPGNITINSKQLKLDRGDISTTSTDKGGNILLNAQDLLLLRQNSQIATDSKGAGNGGNIAIDSKFILATRENNDITANAIKGQGGNVKIDAQGVFGIQFRPQRTSDSDITASSDFGRTGNVQVNTPGVDPGKNNGELVAVPNDTSNQISQVCSANNRQNKLTVTGRGGLPPNANDPLTGDVIWQDLRTVSSQTVVTSAKIDPALVPPAIGWIFDGKGKVSLVAATTQGQPTGTSVACPTITK